MNSSTGNGQNIKPSKTKINLLWIIIFALLIISPRAVYFLTFGLVDTQNHENRNAASKPALNIENIEAYPGQYESYFNDRIPFRNQLIRLNNYIDYFVFKQSSSVHVEIGKDGWLFYRSENDGNPLEQSLGGRLFSDEDLETISLRLISMKDNLAKKDMEFVLFIAPNKETIYREYIPDYYVQESAITQVDQLVSYLSKNTDIRVVYPKDRITKEKSKNPDRPLYYKLDTHWNDLGAYLGAISFTDEFGLKLPSLENVSITENGRSNGDLADLLNIAIPNGDKYFEIEGVSNLATVTEKSDFYSEYIFHTPGADSRRLFVYRDSFSSAMAPYVATQFAESKWVYSGYFQGSQIYDYDPDIFVLEIAERYIEELEAAEFMDIG